MRLVLLFIIVLSFSFSAAAQEAQPNVACSIAGSVVRSGGPEITGKSYLLICDGANWVSLAEYSDTGATLSQIDYDSGSCTASKEGRLRYDSSGNLWEYCRSNAWSEIGGDSAIAGSDGEIQFNSSNNFGSSPNLIWDDSNLRLGVGVPTPDAAVDVAGGIKLGFDDDICAPAKAGTIRYSSGQNVNSFTSPGTTTYTVPPSGISNVTIEVFGAGGSGGNTSSSGGGGGGGGGSQVIRQSGSLLYIAAGGGGGGAGDAGDGGGGGGFARATFGVSASQVFDVYVGGGAQTCSGSTGGNGGAYNGGAGGSSSNPGASSTYGGGGGGGFNDNGGSSVYGGGGGGGGNSNGANSTYGGGGGAEPGRSPGTSTYGLAGLATGEGGGGGTFVEGSGTSVTEIDGATANSSTGGAAANSGPGTGGNGTCSGGTGGDGMVIITELGTNALQFCDGSAWQSLQVQ